MDIIDLREFILLSQTMNFTKAAQDCHMSQSALSNHIMRIEKEVGAKLIDRTQAKIRLTVAGYEFVETASEIVNIYDDFISKRHGGFLASSNHFVMQVLQHADRATSVLLRRIKEFKELYPEVQIEIRESLAFDSLENIEIGAADCGYLGIRLHNPELEEGFIAIPMLEEELTVWLEKTSHLFSKEGFSPKDLENCTIPTWVGLGPNGLETMYGEIFEDFCVTVKYNPRYCISREDYFLNKIHPGDVVILTEGSEAIHSVNVSEERAFRGFDPPIYVKTYVVFKDSPEDSAMNRFKDYLTKKYLESPKG